MNKLFLFIVYLLLFLSCKKIETNDKIRDDIAFNDPFWNRIEVPNAGEIYAIAGSINDTSLLLL